MLRHPRLLPFALLLLAFAACDLSPEDVGPSAGMGDGVPHVSAVGQTSITVGETAFFFGDDFLTANEGRTYLEFDGTFIWEDSTGVLVPEQVTGFSVAGTFDGHYDSGVQVGGVNLASGTDGLRWNRFGPFQVPFGANGRKAGTFTGLVKAVNVASDGTRTEDPNPETFTIEVGPSLVITMLEPVVDFTESGQVVTAGCDSPALRAFSGIPYVLGVEAIGFVPEYFLYEFSNINGESGITKFTHAAIDTLDRVGDPALHQDEIVIFNPLQGDDEFYVASVRITAVGADNQYVETALPLPVVRPVGFHYDGNRQIAQYYKPELVHGPIVGSLGTTITYAESHSEARQQGVSISVARSFTEAHGSVQNTNWTEGFSVTNSQSSTNSQGQSHSEGESASNTYGTGYSSSNSNSVNFNTTDGNTWGWNKSNGLSNEEFKSKSDEIYGSVTAGVSTEVSGEGSVPGFAKVGGKVGTSAGVTAGGSAGNQTGTKSGSTESEGYSMGGSSSENQGFGSTTSDTKSESVSGTYAVNSQATINSSTAATEATSESTTYQMGGSEGLTENFSKGVAETWQETWQTTETDQTLLSFSGKVPNGRCAVVYRQTVRHVRTANLYAYDLCGVRSHLGELYFNEWSWSPNIALGDDCNEEIPASTLPTAACFAACGE